MKKILFLDFDGVMVTDRYKDEQINAGGILCDSHGAVFDPICVENLRQIIDSTSADIVVTSTWKMERGLDGIMWMWSCRHLPGNILNVTPDIDPIHRGDEIQDWLDKWGEECQYVIIDDCPILDFFREEQLPHLFKVNERTGLDEETARKIIEYLNIR